ncbi:hypothetical protein PVK06_047931 [Gossypium arboreum]|uniref:Uncharacterized protein n=1 Tax=Gossypium arboreum TaxID=29729 RepID=A0ABR0MH66_GOSAR|nr:hypothetical protein PVK06_047931 [Gossypium arboreum]
MVRSRGGGRSVQGTTHVVEESSKESTSLSREIDEYMDVQSFMHNVQMGPSVGPTREGNVSSRMKQKTTVGAVNIVLSIEDKDNPIRELCRKKGKDCATTFGDVATTITVPTVIPSPHGSPPLPIPLIEDTFSVIVQHGILGGSMKFMFTSGETQTLFS